MRGILLLAVLTAKSSYSREIEIPLESADDVPDTLQWWLSERDYWRIRTYALDHDIHTYQIAGSRQSTLEALEMAEKNNRKNYGDIIGSQYEIHFVDCKNAAEVDAEFQRIGLAPRIEVAEHFAFWKPDDAPYWTKSELKSD